MLRFILRIVAVVFFLALAIQLVRLPLPNPPVTADLQAPPEVKEVLKKSCYGCHSNETKLAWFDYPVPAYTIVREHVLEARKHINFSEIGKLPVAQQKAALYEGLFQMSRGIIPTPRFLSRISTFSKIISHRFLPLCPLRPTTPAHPSTKLGFPPATYSRNQRPRRTASLFRPTIKTGNQSAAPNALTTTPSAKFSATISPSKPSPTTKSTRGPTAQRSQKSRGWSKPAPTA
jgi:Haem-binding domain